jgi:hypothetical protein
LAYEPRVILNRKCDGLVAYKECSLYIPNGGGQQVQALAFKGIDGNRLS